jgi:hypothetical protein
LLPSNNPHHRHNIKAREEEASVYQLCSFVEVMSRMDWSISHDAEQGGNSSPNGNDNNNSLHLTPSVDENSTMTVEEFWPEGQPPSKQLDKKESFVSILWRGWGYQVLVLLILICACLGTFVYLRASDGGTSHPKGISTDMPPPTHQWVLQTTISNVTNMNVDVFEPFLTLSSDGKSLFYVVNDGVNQDVHLYRYSTVEQQYKQLKHLELSANYSVAFAPDALGLAIGTRQNMSIYTTTDADTWDDNTVLTQNTILLPQTHEEHSIREIILRGDICAVSGIDNIHIDTLRNSIFVTPLVFQQVDHTTKRWDPVLQPNWTEPLPSVGKPTRHLSLAQDGAMIGQCIRHENAVQVLMRYIQVPEGEWMGVRAVSCDAASRVVWALSEDSRVLVVGCETNNFLETWTRQSVSSTTWNVRDNIPLGTDVAMIRETTISEDGSIVTVLVEDVTGAQWILSYQRNTHGSSKYLDWVPLAAPLPSMGGLALNLDASMLSSTVLQDDAVQPAVYQLVPV